MQRNGLTENIIRLLEKRGITGKDDIEEFLSDKPCRTYNPLLLSDMEEGVDLLLSEIASGRRICIYGDYDADGITSTVLMYSVLSHLIPESERSERLTYYIPSRFEEGYGLNTEAIRRIRDNGWEMLVTVDCGSVSKDEVDYAKSLGMTVLVTDHHTITDRMADCLLINPKKPGDGYPFKELSGCGVAFKTAQVIQQKAGLPKSVLTEVLDLAAIGTVGDIMPLIDENRTLVKFGLKSINTSGRPGLRALIKGTGLTPGEITAENIGFVIVPHLNAAGRIDNAYPAAKLLLARECGAESESLVKELLEKNTERKRLQCETYEECLRIMAGSSPDDASANAKKMKTPEPAEIKTDDFIIIKANNAHEGIAGIVAGKIKDNFSRPAVLVTPSGENREFLKGTGRSIEGVDLYQLLKKHEELFEKFGGHAGACGFLMKTENLEALKEGLLIDMGRLSEADSSLFERTLDIDLDISPKDATADFADEIQLLAPFGNRNPKPLLKISNVRLCDIRYMGNDGKHVRFTAIDTDSPGSQIICVLFGKALEYSKIIESGKPVSLVGSLENQVWQGTKRLRFMIDEIVCE